VIANWFTNARGHTAHLFTLRDDGVVEISSVCCAGDKYAFKKPCTPTSLQRCTRCVHKSQRDGIVVLKRPEEWPSVPADTRYTWALAWPDEAA
jgi:hypothetical protein